MKLAVETDKKQVFFFIIDGRYLNKFIKAVKRDCPNFTSIWTYDYLENNGKAVGAFINAKTILTN